MKLLNQTHPLLRQNVPGGPALQLSVASGSPRKWSQGGGAECPPVLRIVQPGQVRRAQDPCPASLPPAPTRLWEVVGSGGHRQVRKHTRFQQPPALPPTRAEPEPLGLSEF